MHNSSVIPNNKVAHIPPLKAHLIFLLRRMVHELLQKLTRLFGRQSLDMVHMRSYIEIHAARCFMLLDEVMFAHLERG